MLFLLAGSSPRARRRGMFLRGPHLERQRPPWCRVPLRTYGTAADESCRNCEGLRHRGAAPLPPDIAAR